jgi:hypothetical protein
VTALVEAATALVSRSARRRIDLPWLKEAAGEALFVGRIAGAALLAIGAVLADEKRCVEAGVARLLTGITIYNAATTALLAYAGAALGMAGLLLWPAVAIHAALAVWCVTCLRARRAEAD